MSDLPKPVVMEMKPFTLALAEPGAALTRFRINRVFGGRLCRSSVGGVLRRLLGNRIPSWGITVNTEDAGFSNVDAAALYFGTYEEAEIMTVTRFLRGDLDVVELGASLGVVSLHILSKLEPGRRLLCVEANPSLIPVLQKYVTPVRRDVETTVLNVAVSSVRTQVELEIPDANRGRVVVSAERRARTVTVEALPLSEILSRNRIGEYVLAMDIEGAEVDVLLNDSTALGGCRQILAEFHSELIDERGASVGKLEETLERLGFTLKVKVLRPGGLSVVLFDRRDAES